MRYHALACDYDGTIAWDGEVSEDTILALQEVRKSGRKLILVTGRELDDLIKVFPRIDLFDRVVAENGALLYRPATREERPLAQRPPDEFWQQLIKRGAVFRHNTVKKIDSREDFDQIDLFDRVVAE